MATSDLQNSYGPEMAPNGHDLPQPVVANGLEPMHPGQHAALAPPYSEQHAKNNQYNNNSDPTQPHDTGRKRRVLGLPVALFWGIVIGLVLILAIGLGVGLGVGLSQRDSSGGSAATAEATTSANADAATTAAPTSTSSTATSSTITSTSSATSAAATARNVEICNQASLVSDCTNITVPVNTCVDFPSSYNDSVSSVDTGGPECDFYTGETCTGNSWTTSGTNYLIPGQYNDDFSSVACMMS
ncbi:hypothetical protein LA080_009637 [Diaporthe eres]|uniref:Uncharacterized protein n=1 Tax=Diaporthe vaccinii TaxID=105482 RepID=A0ABR4DR60_9PEZI|nr:hypothetical protein LA080_009637 [Diaporthe eres]